MAVRFEAFQRCGVEGVARVMLLSPFPLSTVWVLLDNALKWLSKPR